MTDFRTVTAAFSVSPQMSVADVAAAAAEGFVLIINNRPDDEAPGQPPGADIAAEARARGLAYLHLPFVGRPSSQQIEAMGRAVAGSPGRVLAYCRSGTRSITTWAAGQAAGGLLDREEIIRRGAAAGFDLTAVADAFAPRRAGGQARAADS